jgi:diaminohydroxyphosphoribosylaminopyrimidine deaminase/5-amino-6-(5-phosphoribosylamino)uracil reductase
MPFVCIKMAQSRNGVIGVKGRKNVRISKKQFDSYSQRLRNKYDGILAGIGTILADDPHLSCRIKGGRNPARIIMDSSLRIPLSANALRNAKHEKVIIAAGEYYNPMKRRQLERLGARVVRVGKMQPSLSILMRLLPQLGIHSILIEGGAEIARDAVAKRLADKAVVCISPKRLPMKGAVASPFTPAVLAGLKNAKKEKMGIDTVVEGYF